VNKADIKLTEKRLDLQSVASLVEADAAGGTCIFVGTVRNATKGRPVVRLEFEAYEPLALSEMQKIAEVAVGRWPIMRMAIHHRIGTLEIGRSVIIMVSALGRLHLRLVNTVSTLKQTVLSEEELKMAKFGCQLTPKTRMHRVYENFYGRRAHFLIKTTKIRHLRRDVCSRIGTFGSEQSP
jgi:molybdopterin synthase catalytic subunit